MFSVKIVLGVAALVAALLLVPPAAASASEIALARTPQIQSASPPPDPAPNGVAASEYVVPDTQAPPVEPIRLVKPARRGQTDVWGHIMPFGIHNNNYRNGFSVLPPLIVKNGGWPTGSLRIASSFPFFGQSLFLELESDQLAVHHRSRKVGLKGGPSQLVDAGYYREGIVEARGGVRVPHIPIYFGVATYYRSLPGAGSDTDPDLVGGGFGFEMLPDLWKNGSPFGRIYYYPKIETEEPYFNPRTHLPRFLHYSRLIYEGGYSVRFGHGKLFAKAAISGALRRRLNSVPPEAPLTGHCVHLRIGPALRF